MRGIRELLFTRQELIELFTRLNNEYVREDENQDVPVVERSLPEVLADGLINETHSVQDRR